MTVTRLLFLLFFFGGSTVASCQTRTQQHGLLKRYLYNLLLDTADKSAPQFKAYPTLAYSPETSWEVGVSSILAFYSNRDTTNRLSEANAFTFLTLERQYGLWLDHAFYTQANKLFFLGRLRFQDFPLYYHGIGLQTPSQPLAVVNNRSIQIKERILHKVYNSIYAGVEFDYQRLSKVSFVPSTQTEKDLPAGAGGSANLGFGVGVLYDNRHNILNVRHGFFSELAFLSYQHQWSDLRFNTLLSEVRFFQPIKKRNVLAVQALGQFNFGNVPFNQLALLGGESIMRGYYLGRYRDRNLVATQVEFRMLPLPFHFTKRWGAAFFASAGSVYNKPEQLNFNTALWSAGGGIRFLLFPKKDIYTRLDFAFTPESNGIYIYIGEAF